MKIKSLFVLGVAASFVVAGQSAQAAGDAAAGAQLFKTKCFVCHTAEKGGPAKVGPNLFGVVGSGAGKSASYTGKYTEDMTKSGLTWDAATLDKYLEDPKKMVAKTKMTFPGLKDPKERENVIAYLETMK
ncbi:MAG: c-type cytochrome [Magnetococcales bacterium]|nr:c-type cytochrome [Magnetococcales bacterium]